MTSRSEMCFDVLRFKADTAQLSTVELGAYALILYEMHLSEDGWLDENQLQRVARMLGCGRNWKRVRIALDRFLIARDGRVTQKRIQRDILSRTQVADSGGKPSPYIESNPLTLRLPSREESSLESAPRSAKRTRSRSTLPEDAMPGTEHLAYCKEHGFDQDRCISMWRAFKDYHRARGNRMADWLAAWRTWVRNEAKYHPYGYRPNGGSSGKKPGIIDAWDRLSRAVEGSEDNASGQGSLLGISDRSVR